MNDRSATATDFRLSLEAGLVDRAEIIQWADGIIETEGYDERIAEISMAGNQTDKDLISLLASISGHTEDWDGVRRMLGRMHDALLRDADRLHEFTSFLDRLLARNDNEVPGDMHFIYGLEDDCQLAETVTYWCTPDEFRTDLIKELARFQPEAYAWD